jgi:hypothetical protein
MKNQLDLLVNQQPFLGSTALLRSRRYGSYCVLKMI